MGWRAIVVGAIVGGGAGGATTLLFLAILHREPPRMLPAIVGIVLGMVAAHYVRLLTAPAATESPEEPAPVATVGRVCTVCDSKIRVVLDATECDDCGDVFHDGCFEDHPCG